MSEEYSFYGIDDQENLDSDLQQCVDRYLDDMAMDAEGDANWIAKLPEFVEVQGFEPFKIDLDRHCEWYMEHLLEHLEEDYGCFDEESGYTFSEEAEKLYKAFIEKVKSEFPVWRCEPKGEAFKIRIRDYINEEDQVNAA